MAHVSKFTTAVCIASMANHGKLNHAPDPKKEICKKTATKFSSNYKYLPLLDIVMQKTSKSHGYDLLHVGIYFL